MYICILQIYVYIHKYIYICNHNIYIHTYMYVYIITSPILLMHCLTFFSTGLMTLGRNREPPKRQVNVTSDYPPSCWSVIFFSLVAKYRNQFSPLLFLPWKVLSLACEGKKHQPDLMGATCSVC